MFREAAIELNTRINHIKNSQSITTVADQTDYTLNADFIRLYRVNRLDRHFIKYNDGTSNYWPTEKDEDSVILADNTTSQSIPDNFYITDDKTLDSLVTGTATSSGALSAGKTTLTDTAGDFTDVSAGDNIHNTTDGSMGIVISKTSSTVLVTALFGGTDNDWDSSDAYVIQPQGRYKIVLDPPPSQASHTVTVFYTQKPVPVYSDYDHLRFPIEYDRAMLSYAAWLYKYRDREPNFGDSFFVAFDNIVRRSAYNTNRAQGRNRVNVDFKRRQVNY